MLTRLRSHYWTIMVIAFSCLILGSEAAFAAPGGIVKAVTETKIGRILMLLLMILFLPWVIKFYWERATQIKKTKQDLKTLAAIYPQYRWMDLNTRVREVFGWVWSGWTQRDMNKASEFTTHWYWQNQQLLLEDWHRQGLQNVSEMHAVKSVTPIYVEHSPENQGEGSRLVVTIAARVRDYMMETATGKVVSGDKKVGDLETVWTFRWVGGRWLLDNIEALSTEMTYLREQNILPVPTERAGQPTTQ